MLVCADMDSANADPKTVLLLVAVSFECDSLPRLLLVMVYEP